MPRPPGDVAVVQPHDGGRAEVVRDEVGAGASTQRSAASDTSRFDHVAHAVQAAPPPGAP